RADRQGNVLVEGIIGVQKEVVLAAGRSIVTVEEIVDDLAAGPNACVIPGWAIDAIVVAKHGAYPSYAHGYYPRDNAFYKAWDAIARDRETFDTWLQGHVFSQGDDA
ncbi:MAG: CoA transferase subunit A, partial [Pseudomonadota bacterium]|nr:CoA transferase subunit A [Pseudomonadota bacterium]